ncbi:MULTISPECIES: flagellar FlbD family protein [unclassified Paenibacillus]|uniref:flagellar FlbD family protein n=1 Tax=unclassified Paenibacillus TaxID=185978 RepID=UPI002F406115
MITVTRLNGTKITINALLIETVDEAADTIITLTTGNRIVVKEKASELVKLCQQYFQEIGVVGIARSSKQTEGPLT